MENYVGEIRPVGFNFAPEGWVFCDGSLLQIADYNTLFALIGTTYGGDGQTTFGVPDLRGRVPLHAGSVGGTGYAPGQSIGSESVALLSQQLGSHIHLVNTGPAGNVNVPSGSTVLADVGGDPQAQIVYNASANQTAMAIQSIGYTGGAQSHENRQPYLVINYIIATEGVYPTQN